MENYRCLDIQKRGCMGRGETVFTFNVTSLIPRCLKANAKRVTSPYRLRADEARRDRTNEKRCSSQKYVHIDLEFRLVVGFLRNKNPCTFASSHTIRRLHLERPRN